jgi:hypothetical protein
MLLIAPWVEEPLRAHIINKGKTPREPIVDDKVFQNLVGKSGISESTKYKTGEGLFPLYSRFFLLIKEALLNGQTLAADRILGAATDSLKSGQEVEKSVDLMLDLTRLFVERDPKRYFPNWMVLKWLEVQKNKCWYCTIEFNGHIRPVGDHILPWSLGGRTIYENGCAACKRCNDERKTMSPVEWKAKVTEKYAGGRSL